MSDVEQIGLVALGLFRNLWQVEQGPNISFMVGILCECAKVKLPKKPTYHFFEMQVGMLVSQGKKKRLNKLINRLTRLEELFIKGK